ncbi:uncharacterized protein [Miscanthus floridulus]|uniref:uncharacterized protein isoform X1 n=1 Tax=Miscanthus floridulus TaxID=154761 RepID=UPI00345B0E46
MSIRIAWIYSPNPALIFLFKKKELKGGYDGIQKWHTVIVLALVYNNKAIRDADLILDPPSTAWMQTLAISTDTPRSHRSTSSPSSTTRRRHSCSAPPALGLPAALALCMVCLCCLPVPLLVSCDCSRRLCSVRWSPLPPPRPPFAPVGLPLRLRRIGAPVFIAFSFLCTHDHPAHTALQSILTPTWPSPRLLTSMPPGCTVAASPACHCRCLIREDLTHLFGSATMYCGVGWTGCEDEVPCDDIDACCCHLHPHLRR